VSSRSKKTRKLFSKSKGKQIKKHRSQSRKDPFDISQLTNKIAALEISLKEANKAREKLQISLKAKIAQLVSEKFDHNKTIVKLCSERDSMALEIAVLKKKKSVSPEKRKGDLFAG
jgi:hypothetical protein